MSSPPTSASWIRPHLSYVLTTNPDELDPTPASSSLPTRRAPACPPVAAPARSPAGSCATSGGGARELPWRQRSAQWCVQFQPAARPSMCNVVRMLEGEMAIVPPANPFHYVMDSNIGSTNSGLWSDTSHIPK